jgi:type I restriction enzyme, S subunit
MTSNSWAWRRWGDIATLEYGKSLRNYQTTNGTYRVYGTNGPIGWHSQPLCNHSGVVIGRKGAYRGVHYSSAPFFVIDTAFYLEPKIEFDLKWAYYQLLTQDINAMDSGSAIPSTSRGDFYNLEVPVPPIAEQHLIGQILSSLDDKIELNRRMNQTLEAMAQALFKSWFVDFDPVRAKAEGRTPAGMDAETAALFPDSFEDSVLGEIPRGWPVTPFSQQMTILSGGTPRTTVPEYWDGGVPWVSVVDTVPGPYITETEKTVSHSGVVNSAAKLLPGETVVITARGTVGNCALLAGPMSMNQSCYGLRGTNGVGQLFLLQQLRDQVGRLQASAHGSVFDTITRSTFDSLDVVAPDVSTLAKYESAVRPLFDFILNSQRESKTLAAIRDALLPKLLSGEIRVKEALEAFNVIL